MSKIDIPADLAKKLQDIQNKYDIFFRVHNKQIGDYFEFNFNTSATLKLKEGSDLPFTLINDLKEHFQLIEST